MAVGHGNLTIICSLSVLGLIKAWLLKGGTGWVYRAVPGGCQGRGCACNTRPSSLIIALTGRQAPRCTLGGAAGGAWDGRGWGDQPSNGIHAHARPHTHPQASARACVRPIRSKRGQGGSAAHGCPGTGVKIDRCREVHGRCMHWYGAACAVGWSSPAMMMIRRMIKFDEHV